MRSLYEKLNGLDESLVESRRVVKKKLTESVEDDKKKLFDAAESVKCKLDDDTIEYAMYDVDDFIENELVYCGKLLLAECPDMMFWTFGSDSDFGSYCEVYETDDEVPDAFYQISHDRIYDITDEINGDYDDDIDEMLTESAEQYELSTLVKDSINHLVNNLGKDPMADDFGDDVCGDLEDNYDIDVPQNPVKYADWCDAVMSEVSRQLNNKEEQLTENRWNPYFTPYGYKDAAKVLNGKAPEYYYHIKEIEMDRGDGVKLARYAMRKGLPVMVDKNRDPDYPEFAIKGEYHWNDYFYPYSSAHEEDFVVWDGKMFTEQSLTEDYEGVTFDSIADKIVDYAEKHPETLSNMRYVYDYIDNLNQEGVWYIPAALGDFVANDVDNITEAEAEEFIDMLMHKTDVNSRLIALKKSKSQGAWSKLRDKFPTL